MAQTGDTATDDQSVGATSQSDTRRAVEASAIRNATEWYDFGIYSYLTTILAKIFYPESGLAVVATFATFSVAFAARPLGGMVFGVLPAFSAVGIWAPILLVATRLVQGFSTGGEYAGAATFVAAYAPDERRGFLGSFLCSIAGEFSPSPRVNALARQAPVAYPANVPTSRLAQFRARCVVTVLLARTER